jgi:hypothetical protein
MLLQTLKGCDVWDESKSLKARRLFLAMCRTNYYTWCTDVLIHPLHTHRRLLWRLILGRLQACGGVAAELLSVGSAEQLLGTA